MAWLANPGFSDRFKFGEEPQVGLLVQIFPWKLILHLPLKSHLDFTTVIIISIHIAFKFYNDNHHGKPVLRVPGIKHVKVSRDTLWTFDHCKSFGKSFVAQGFLSKYHLQGSFLWWVGAQFAASSSFSTYQYPQHHRRCNHNCRSHHRHHDHHDHLNHHCLC